MSTWCGTSATTSQHRVLSWRTTCESALGRFSHESFTMPCSCSRMGGGFTEVVPVGGWGWGRGSRDDVLPLSVRITVLIFSASTSVIRTTCSSTYRPDHRCHTGVVLFASAASYSLHPQLRATWRVRGLTKWVQKGDN